MDRGAASEQLNSIFRDKYPDTEALERSLEGINKAVEAIDTKEESEDLPEWLSDERHKRIRSLQGRLVKIINNRKERAEKDAALLAARDNHDLIWKPVRKNTAALL